MDTARLEEIAKAFSEWRASKKTDRDRFPEELLERARGLSGEFSETMICQRVQVSRRRLFPKKKQETETVAAKQFIEVPVLDGSEEIRVEIRNKGKTISVCLPGSTDLKELLAVLKS